MHSCKWMISILNAWNLPPLLTALSTPYALMILHHCQHTADFTLRATDTGDDMLSGEDKPSHIVRKNLQTAIVKNWNLRILSTQVTKKRPRLNTYFDAFTTTWHGLQLVVDDIKETEGRLIHYRAAECVVSLLPGKTSTASNTVQGGLLIQAKMAALPPMNSDKKLRQYQKVLDEVLATNMDMMLADKQTLETIKQVDVAQQLDLELEE